MRDYYLRLRRLILLLLTFVCSPYISNAQVAVAEVDDPSQFKVMKLEEKISTLKNSSDAGSKSEADSLTNFAYTLMPTLYCTKKQFVQTGDGNPVRLISDVSDLNLLYKENSAFDNIEFLCIKLEKASDLNKVLKVSKLAGFSKLKYIHFMCTFNMCYEPRDKTCELGIIEDLIQDNDNSKIKILYTLSSNE